VNALAYRAGIICKIFITESMGSLIVSCIDSAAAIFQTG
jgi:hypothetical protein